MLALIDMVNKNGVSINENKSLKKSGNKMVKILPKLKSQNLFNSKHRNLSRARKV